MSGAYRKRADGSWEPIDHLTVADLTDAAERLVEFRAADVISVLRDHQFTENPPPGLYPEAPTVCSCEASPASDPGGEDAEYEWWIEHVLTQMWGL